MILRPPRSKRTATRFPDTTLFRAVQDRKAQHRDALLLVRMGDFYETFDEDAEVAARVLGIALTSRPMGGDGARIPLAGIPYHQLDRYLDQLVAAGYRAAIGELGRAPV